MSAEKQQAESPRKGDRWNAPPKGATVGASLEALARLSSNRSGLRDTLTHIATLAVRAVPGADGAGLTLFEPDRPDVMVSSAPFVTQVDAAQYGIGQGPCISAAAEATAIRSRSLTKDPRWPEFGETVGRLGVHSSLSLPLLSAGNVLGSINIYAHRKRAFSARSQHDGEVYAVSAVQAVTEAQHRQATQSNAGTIGRAIALVMRRSGVGAVEAYALLQDLSARRQLELTVVAQLVANGTVTVDRWPRPEQE